MFAKSLLDELRNEKNKYLDENSTFNLVKIYTDFITTLFIVSIIIGLIVIILNNSTTILYNISFNELSSFTLGNIAYLYSFRMIKENLIPYYSSNPIMIIGIVYPAFFNAKIISLMVSSNLAISSILNITLLIISIFVYYFIINKYYLNKYQIRK